jgi:16S rRNA (guanine527-N7)-methyltransferase
VTEDEAQAWLRDVGGISRETFERLDAFRRMVIDETGRQNLISAGTIDQFWARHIVDSAQLLTLAPDKGVWLDLGTGAGFPGMVVAIMRASPVIFVESRRKRSDFLSESVKALGLSNVRVQGSRLETMETVPVSVVSARAFTALPRLFELAHRFSTEKTYWVLPKGRSATEELESARTTWQGAFHVKQSITDAEAAIIVATAVSPRKQARKQAKR